MAKVLQNRFLCAKQIPSLMRFSLFWKQNLDLFIFSFEKVNHANHGNNIYNKMY
jgi:hypothetical protein